MPPDGILTVSYPTVVDSMTVDLIIGTVSGPEEMTFGNIRDIEVNSDGEIYVLDTSVGTVRIFDSSGEYVRSLGRLGEGPAEFRSPTQMTLARDGSVWVYDDGARVVVA
jgi:hypothetical protein